MMIQSSSIGMSSTHTYTQTLSETSVVSSLGTGSVSSGTLLGNSNGSGQSPNGLFQTFRPAENLKIHSAFETASQKALRKIRMDSIRFLFRLLFGEDVSHRQSKTEMSDSKSSSASFSSANPFQAVSGTIFTASESFEAETTSFSTTGTVVTADGQELHFHVNFEMSRSFYSYASQYTQFGAQLCDPLVINLDTDTASVYDQTFLFDLDADGKEEQISMLNKRSGFLAYDKNHDGTINDGTELFGTKTGDGFLDLSKYDQDHNGWIDEADDIFKDLVIWCKDSNGKDELCGLGAAGIGAIYLGSTDTPFSLNSAADNHTNAVIQKTGLFLYENGGVGTIQHVDLVKHEYTY